MSIIEDARELYRQTITDPDYGKSHIWRDGGGNHQDLMKIINTCSSPSAVEAELEKTDMYAIRISDEKTFNLMMEWHKNLLGEFNVCTTPNLYKMLKYCDDIFKACGDQKRIVELGGGNGQFSFMARHALDNRVHVDIDIPESLYMAYVCTRNRFPDARVLWVTDKKFNIDDYDFIFCPVGYESNLIGIDFDIFVNTASMGELPNASIRYWMDFVQNKLSVKYFFGFNRFLNTVYPESTVGFSMYRLGENEASVLFDARWDILSWEVEPLVARCPYEDPKIARYLEIILRRSTRRVLPHGYLDDVKMEDWWRYRTANTIGTHRSNQLVNDYTVDGTLFKLWNAMRLSPSDETTEMLLTYFNHIGRHGLAFEEEYFYKKYLHHGIRKEALV